VGWTDVRLTEQRQRRQHAPLRDKLPSLEAGLAAFRGRIRELAGHCAHRGVRLIFATQPVLWREHLSPQAAALLWSGAPDGIYYSPAALRRGMELYNDALLEECAALGLECIELSELSGREDLY
jgi:hypothetical protein